MSGATGHDGVARLAIEGDLTIYRAAELREAILAAQDGAECLVIDLGAVEEIDTAGLQLLVLAKRQALAGGHALRLVNHSRAVLEVFEMLDLVGYFGDAVVMS